jgi:hypothetical protein
MDPAPWSLVNLFVSLIVIQRCGTVAIFHASDLMISLVNLPTLVMKAARIFEIQVYSSGLHDIMSLKTEFLERLFVLFVRNSLNICHQQRHLHAAYLLMNDHLLVKSVKHMLLT